MVRKDCIVSENPFSFFDNKNVGVLTGTAFDLVVKDKLPNIKQVYFNTYPSQIKALIFIS